MLDRKQPDSVVSVACALLGYRVQLGLDVVYYCGRRRQSASEVVNPYGLPRVGVRPYSGRKQHPEPDLQLLEPRGPYGKVVEAVVGGVVSPSCDCFLQEHDIFTSYAVLPPERSRVLVVAQRHDSAIADYASVPRSLVKQVLVEVCWYSS